MRVSDELVLASARSIFEISKIGRRTCVAIFFLNIPSPPVHAISRAPFRRSKKKHLSGDIVAARCRLLYEKGKTRFHPRKEATITSPVVVQPSLIVDYSSFQNWSGLFAPLLLNFLF